MGTEPTSTGTRGARNNSQASCAESHSLDPAQAEPLAATAASTDDLASLAERLPPGALDAAVRWVAAGCTTHTLARDIDRAAGRIHELVAAVKRFTYMDNLDVPELVDVGAGIRDTLRVLASKAKDKGATITMDLDPDLPRVDATGSELNQVWLNLVDA